MGNRDAIMRRLGAILTGWTYERLERALAPLQMWYARVQTYDDLPADPQIRNNGSIGSIPISTGRAFTVLNHPVSYDGALPPPAFRRDARRRHPRGSGGRRLLPADIDRLAARNVIRCTSGSVAEAEATA